MYSHSKHLTQALKQHFGSGITSIDESLKELTIEVAHANYLEIMQALRDHPDFAYEQLIDLCGVDYSTYTKSPTTQSDQSNNRFAVVSHLLSITKNQRLRVRVFAENDHFPSVDSVINIWSSASWYEREAFDLFGIVFPGHPDLRRILTDYGFIGHPFRKDFPVSGHVEMRYDPEQCRVVYQPVSIEPRENTPRIVRNTPPDTLEHERNS